MVVTIMPPPLSPTHKLLDSLNKIVSARPAPFLLSPGINRHLWPFIQAIIVCDRSHSSLAVSWPARDALFSVRINGMPLA